MTSWPGLFAVSALPSGRGTRAAMDKESLPPSMDMPSSTIMSLSAFAASYIFGPSPSSLAAHIQLPDALIESKLGIFTQTKFVSDSATARRAMAQQLAGSPTRPFSGASPMAVAPPVKPMGLCAMHAKLDSGVCRGPMHCCCAMSPVTDLSTLFVRKRFEHTESNRRTPVVKAFSMVKLAGRTSSRGGFVYNLFISKTFWGILPKTKSSGRSTGTVLSRESFTTTLPSPVIVPTTQ
mmetsp:Transcript_155941/g.498332  ORF Transcript_155941/g.498332 Transcript_155941/m.498332 type:complete len:236 (+) Transcript_155941:1829-2536(+)